MQRCELHFGGSIESSLLILALMPLHLLTALQSLAQALGLLCAEFGCAFSNFLCSHSVLPGKSLHSNIREFLRPRAVIHWKEPLWRFVIGALLIGSE